MKKSFAIIFHPFSDLKRSLKTVFLLFFVIPILVSLYMLFDMGIQGTTFQEYLNNDLSHAVLFLLSLLYFIWAYLLFKLYMLSNVEDKQYISFILWVIFFSQLFVGNVLLIGILGIILYTHNLSVKTILDLKFLKRHKLVTLLLFFVVIIEVFCVSIMLRGF